MIQPSREKAGHMLSCVKTKLALNGLLKSSKDNDIKQFGFQLGAGGDTGQNEKGSSDPNNRSGPENIKVEMFDSATRRGSLSENRRKGEEDRVSRNSSLPPIAGTRATQLQHQKIFLANVRNKKRQKEQNPMFRVLVCATAAGICQIAFEALSMTAVISGAKTYEIYRETRLEIQDNEIFLVKEIPQSLDRGWKASGTLTILCLLLGFIHISFIWFRIARTVKVYKYERFEKFVKYGASILTVIVGLLVILNRTAIAFFIMAPITLGLGISFTVLYLRVREVVASLGITKRQNPAISLPNSDEFREMLINVHNLTLKVAGISLVGSSSIILYAAFTISG